MDRYTLTQSRRLAHRTRSTLPGGTHYNFRSDERSSSIPFKTGDGSRLWDHDGNEHLDLFCKFGALILGHGHPHYKSRLNEQIDRLTAVNQTGIESAVCEKIVEHVPSAEMVRFGLSGTEMVQNTIRLARAYTGRNRILRFKGHYHGNADNVMGGRSKQSGKPVALEFEGDPMGTEGRADGILKDQSLLIPWNDPETFTETMHHFGDEIAIVLMEPGCLNGGGILPDEGYLQHVREGCTRHGIVLAFDEVITGFRTGLGGAQSNFGVVPDLTILGKALAGGGLPVSALAGQRDLMELYAEKSVVHAGTFNGYALGLAAVQATMEILEEDPDCYKRMGDALTQITDVLTRAAEDVGLPMSVQGFPQAQVFHVRSEPLSSIDDYDTATNYADSIVRKACAEYGIQICPTSRLYANAALDESDVAFFEDRIYDALQDAVAIL